MAVNEGLAHLSDTLFTTAIATYSVAMVGYCFEYAFGRKGRIADTSAQAGSDRVLIPARDGVAARDVVQVQAPARDRSLVLAGSAVDDQSVSAFGSSSSSSVSGGGTSAGGASGGGSSGRGGIDVPVTPNVRVLDADTALPRRAWAERLGRGAVLVTVIGALIHLASIILRGAAVDRVPWGNMYEFSMVVGLIAVVAWLLVLWRMPALRYLGLFVLIPVIMIMFLAGNVLYAQAQPLVPALQSYWLAIHVSAAASGEGMLMTSAVLAILYLIKVRYDANELAGRRSRFPISIGDRLPAPEALDKSSYRIVAFAFPIFTFGVICGAIWAEAAWGRYWGWDPKETWAFISWVIYAAYLHARATAGWKGRNAAYINVVGFAAMTFNFFVINIFVSGLHSYAGLN